MDREARYIAYADSTDNPKNGNGVMFLGAAFPRPLQETCVQMFPPKEQQATGALGHVLGISTYTPDSMFTYYWGSGWSKGDVKDLNAWVSILEDFAGRIGSPLEVSVTR